MSPVFRRPAWELRTDSFWRLTHWNGLLGARIWRPFTERPAQEGESAKSAA